MKKDLKNEIIPLVEHKKDMILEQLRKKGFRITEQRKLLIDIILEDECSSCKEIYYKAVKKDSSVGIATVYRMVKTLEDLEVINRKNLYHIDYDDLNLKEEQKIIFIDGDSEQTMEINKGEWFVSLQKALMQQGIKDVNNLSILIKKNEINKEEECDDRLRNNCRCRNTSCHYHCQRNTGA